jgi:hypothetical protein
LKQDSVSKNWAETTGQGQEKQLMRTNLIHGLTEGLKAVAPTDSGFLCRKPMNHSSCKKTKNNRLTSSDESCLIGEQQPKLTN